MLNKFLDPCINRRQLEKSLRLLKIKMCGKYFIDTQESEGVAIYFKLLLVWIVYILIHGKIKLSSNFNIKYLWVNWKASKRGKTQSFPLETNKQSADWGKITSQKYNYFIFFILEYTDKIVEPLRVERDFRMIELWIHLPQEYSQKQKPI